MPELAHRPSLVDLQQYVKQLEVERGFAQQDVLQKCLLLGEEVGELFKAVRKLQGLGVDVTAQVGGAAGELADVLIYVCAIANRLGVDLEDAFRAKEELNRQRRWA
ncbi:MAG: MazG nucleotide pyrophosphohydrolase domain-containing protein [Myxococcota bacterium]